jgi:hypothetical protein
MLGVLVFSASALLLESLPAGRDDAHHAEHHGYDDYVDYGADGDHHRDEHDHGDHGLRLAQPRLPGAAGGLDWATWARNGEVRPSLYPAAEAPGGAQPSRGASRIQGSSASSSTGSPNPGRTWSPAERAVRAGT